MHNIRVVHDKAGCYSDWDFSSFHEGIQEPWLMKYHHDYFEAKRKPNYPMPTLIGETFIVKDTVAMYHTNRDTKVIEMIWWKN